MNNNVSRLIFDAAISKAFDNIEMVKPSIHHYFSGGKINGNFREALLKLMNWVEKNTIEAANEAMEAARKDEAMKVLEWVQKDSGVLETAEELYQIFKTQTNG